MQPIAKYFGFKSKSFDENEKSFITSLRIFDAQQSIAKLIWMQGLSANCDIIFPGTNTKEDIKGQ